MFYLDRLLKESLFRQTMVQNFKYFIGTF